MKSKINHFALVLAIVAIICQLLIALFFETLVGFKPTLLVQLFPAYFLLINVIIHSFLLKASEKSPNKFVNTFILLTSAKMMISLIIIVVIVFTNKPNFLAPALTFAFLYLLFTILEVILIVQDLNNLKNKP